MRFAPLLLALLLLAPCVGARAADATATVPVVFSAADSDRQDQKLLDAIREALSRVPSFNLMAKITPQALVIAVPDGLGRSGHEERTSYSFMAQFFRNGEKIGESQEGCKASALSDCADQLATDAQSAAKLAK
jgi:hypothetical protein